MWSRYRLSRLYAKLEITMALLCLLARICNWMWFAEPCRHGEVAAHEPSFPYLFLTKVTVDVNRRLIL